jgi:hypothetical protein
VPAPEDELVSRLAEEVAERGLSARRPLCTLDVTSEHHTHPKIGFDGILSGSAEEPRCEIVAYHDDHSATHVTNLRIGNDPDFAQPSTS